MVPCHVLPPVALLTEPFAALVTSERFYVEVHNLVVPVVLGLAALAVEHPVTHITPPLLSWHWEGREVLINYVIM